MRIKSGNLLLFAAFLITQVILSSLIDIGPLLFISVYPLFLLTLPTNTTFNKMLLWAFFMGIVVDYFTNSILGLNSSAALTLVLFQSKIFKLVCRKGDLENQIRPGLRELGFVRFTTYIALSLAVHHISLSLVESFGLTSFIYNLPRVAVSLFANTILILVIEFGFFYKNRL